MIFYDLQQSRMPNFHFWITFLRVMKNGFHIATENEKDIGYHKVRNQWQQKTMTLSTEILLCIW